MDANTLISAGYLAIMKHSHAEDEWGTTAHLNAYRILPWLINSGSNTLLDYGAGKGSFKNAPEMQGYTVHEYDPAIPKISKSPAPCGFVVCIDVLEHVEPECLRSVMEDLKRVGINEGYFIISLVPAYLTLIDGRNAHIMLREASWWENFVGQYFKITGFRPFGLKSGVSYPWPDGRYPYANVHINVKPLGAQDD